MNRVAISLSLLLLAACQAVSETRQACPYQGKSDEAPSAGCLVVVHGKMLVVDSRRGGLTPPGGKMKKGESAQCTAHRETLEETGLDLKPGELLKVFDTGFHLYACDIHAESGSIDAAILEVKRSFWLDLDDFDAVQWRYPGQEEVLREILMPGSASADTGRQSSQQAR